jgi:hypothetical protein
MATEKTYLDSIDAVRADGKKLTLAEIIARTLKDKIIEVYVGDTYETINYEESSLAYASVLVGKVVGAYTEGLILNCVYIDQTTKKLEMGNIVCLNERAIRFFTELDDHGMLRDTFLNTRDGKLVKEFLGRHK